MVLSQNGSAQLCLTCGFRYEAIVPGKVEFMVEYREKIYEMESEEKLLKFMR